MLGRLAGEPTQQYFCSWHTTVKLVHQVLRSTFTYLMKGYLAGDQPILRKQMLARIPGFLSSLT